MFPNPCVYEVRPSYSRASDVGTAIDFDGTGSRGSPVREPIGVPTVSGGAAGYVVRGGLVPDPQALMPAPLTSTRPIWGQPTVSQGEGVAGTSELGAMDGVNGVSGGDGGCVVRGRAGPRSLKACGPSR